MTISERILRRLYIAGVGAATTIVTQRLLTFGWTIATGHKPPAPGDPDAPLTAVLTWTIASSVGIAATQLLTRRYTLRHLMQRVSP